MDHYVGVYCGGTPGDLPAYAQAASQLGRLLGEQGAGLVYGGASMGLMGLVADSYVQSGGRDLVGVLPEQFGRLAHPALGTTHLTQTLAERKQQMLDLADCFIALPGGLGTLDETVELLELARVGLHTKPVGLLNVEGYYDHLVAFLDRMTASGFCSTRDREHLVVGNDPALVLERLRQHRPQAVDRWWTVAEPGARLAPFDPHDPAVVTEPGSVYARYREFDPVHWGKPYKRGGDGCWYLFTHREVVSVLRDRRFVRQWPPTAPADRLKKVPEEERPFWAVYDRLLLSTDPPAHRRLRALVSKAFTPRTVRSYGGLVQQTAEQLADALTDDFDLIEDYATPLSLTVICAILGVPRTDGERLREWITSFAAGLELRQGRTAMASAGAAAAGLAGYFGDLVAERRSTPGQDLLSGLIAARDAEDRLSEDELLAMCVQLLFAGHETTVSQIGRCMLDLHLHPEQLAMVRQQPSLVAGAVAESLRLNGSVQTAAARKPIEDIVVGDRLIRAGQPVIAFIGAANRDPAVFADPDRFDLQRDNSAAVGFGVGIHHCLGASLAQLQVERAIATLLSRRPHLRPSADAAPVSRPSVVLPGLSQLPMTG